MPDLCGRTRKLCATVLDKLTVVDTESPLIVTDEEARVHVGFSELQSFAGAEASVQVRLTCPVKLPMGVMSMMEGVVCWRYCCYQPQLQD